MIVPKQEVYELLSEIATTYQQRPEVISTFPCITFSMSDNSVTMSLGKEISYQDVQFVIDIYTSGKTASVDASELLIDVEEALRAEGYKLVYSADVPDPNDDVIHISTRFNLVT